MGIARVEAAENLSRVRWTLLEGVDALRKLSFARVTKKESFARIGV
jgi:hypothetical protein